MTKIIEFQKSVGLHPDGIIGIRTLTALGNRLAISDIQLANFMGQLHHETGGFKYDTESLNYSVSGLMKTFSYYRKHPGEAWTDGRTLIKRADQETIANKVYWDLNRSPSHYLGNKSWGDGWKYRGRGAIQITGRYNYAGFENFVGYDIVEFPEKVATDLYWECAFWFFEKNKLWSLAGKITSESMTDLTRRINGGLNGLNDRIRMTRFYYYILNK